MVKDKQIGNALKRSEVHRKNKREKGQAKLKRRLEIKKAEKEKGVGEELKRQRLAKNVPRTLDNTRIYDSSSYLTANPATLRQPVVQAKQRQPESDEEENSDDDDEAMAGPSSPRASNTSDTHNAEDQDDVEAEEPSIDPSQLLPPKILITTSASPCKLTYQFCDDLKNVFPGGEVFKRPRGKGFELGRISRWASKRGYGAAIVINEDHKTPNALTLIKLPSGPTAYFKLTSIVLSRQILGHARPSPHSPELILNNFTTLLGNAVGRLFGSLFPPIPQFQGRQAVTLHNQRDYLFFRRHRYVFDSPDAARLQEIGPRFTLKLRWLKKGLPTVTAADGRIPGAAAEEDEDVEDQERDEEKAALGEIGQNEAKGKAYGKMEVPLDEEQEYEWRWKPRMEVSRRTFYL